MNYIKKSDIWYRYLFVSLTVKVKIKVQIVNKYRENLPSIKVTDAAGMDTRHHLY